MFDIRNVSKRYADEFALRDISLTLGGGMNFVIGSSGSGKTTLLKIISGMETEFDGEASYCGKSIKSMSETEKSALWGSNFGFVWQDFNLLDDRTVLENILLPQYLQQSANEATAKALLRELKISELTNQKVGKLSGGQKQRVAIARELMKNPQVIFADEPTSALDAQSAKAIMDILRTIARKRTVIIVTHDTSLITARDKVYELDKGELVSIAEPEKPRAKKPSATQRSIGRLSLRGALSLGVTSIKRRAGGAAATILSCLLAATLLLVSVSGAISDRSKAAFDDLIATYGESLLDISIVKSFTSASGTDGNESDSPNADVTQNIDGLFEKYRGDPRVDYVLFAQAFNNIKVTVDGNEYSVEGSNTMPIANGIVEGTMPLGDGNEVAVPESFVKKLGISNDQAIGKEISFSAAVYNWESGESVLTVVNTTATIVGVVDTDMVTEFEGEIYNTTIEDSFFFSPKTLGQMLSDAGMGENPGSFYIRAKNPQALIELKDELNAEGIVPLGHFELVEDMVRLDNQTTQQSGTAIILISALSIIVVLAVALLNSVLRKREYAIFKVSGYSNSNLVISGVAEYSLLAVATAVVFLLLSPLINLATSAFWDVNILNTKLLSVGVLLTICMAFLSCLLALVIASSTKAIDALKAGDR